MTDDLATAVAERDRARSIAVALEQENAVLRAVWEWVWNGPGGADYGDHCGYSWADDQHLCDLAEAVEDFDLRAALDPEQAPA